MADMKRRVLKDDNGTYLMVNNQPLTYNAEMTSANEISGCIAWYGDNVRLYGGGGVINRDTLTVDTEIYRWEDMSWDGNDLTLDIPSGNPIYSPSKKAMVLNNAGFISSSWLQPGDDEKTIISVVKNLEPSVSVKSIVYKLGGYNNNFQMLNVSKTASGLFPISLIDGNLASVVYNDPTVDDNNRNIIVELLYGEYIGTFGPLPYYQRYSVKMNGDVGLAGKSGLSQTTMLDVNNGNIKVGWNSGWTTNYGESTNIELSELIIYDHRLDSDEIIKITDYLNKKYSIY